MTECLICEGDLQITSLSCPSCKTEYKGMFYFHRLSRLSVENISLAEALILHGGNLKEMAEDLNTSYPTLKRRLKALSSELGAKKREDEDMVAKTLKDVELKNISPEEGIKIIQEINGGV